MKKNRYFWLLKKIFQFGMIFMSLETLYHFSGIRISGTESVWPHSAVKFSQFLMFLWASVSLFLTGYLFFLQKQLQQYRDLIVWTGLFAIFHGFLLWWCASQNYEAIMPLTTLYFWNPFYSIQLIIEGSILIIIGLYIVYGWQKKYFSK